MGAGCSSSRTVQEDAKTPHKPNENTTNKTTIPTVTIETVNTSETEQQQQQQQQEQEQEQEPEPEPVNDNQLEQEQVNDEDVRGREEFSNFVKEALQVHNELRAKHGVPPLTINKELCEKAQEWSDHLAKTEQFEHSPDNRRFMWNGKEATMMWYNEIKDYNFNKQGFTMGTGHFTQVVWKDTKVLGIAKSTGPKGNTIVTANYLPPGNFQGDFEENVLPLI
ncbi:Golgi-associated plant pathogenesis-related protein 1 [Patella vulgata]|uniref:Golgi-associated plant pathogenesis-related protein 1 n=1 Tax=Patella vulgata TaxID=6465 RepID=UPI0024A844A3|nr:Golgi-associated plant pathogenesis-related protein 1 [Patella vulgata]